MLALDNRTPYAAERTFVRDKAGADHWAVAIKATYAIGPAGKLELADEQLPPLLAPEHWGEPGVSSIRYEADLTLIKPATDVLVNGSAYAPGGRALPQVPVRLRVGGVDKALVVKGPSVYFSNLLGVSSTDPLPFVQAPLRYEDAYGGTDTTAPDPAAHRLDARNPIGSGFATRPAHLRDKQAPRVVYPKGDPAKQGPAGFGAVASHWSPRRELGGTYDDVWLKEQHPLLPVDWKPENLLCAPADQRMPGHLYGGEPIQLTNLTPEGVLWLELPKVYLALTTYLGRDQVEHRCKMTSVIIEPDDCRLIVVWLSTLQIPLRMMDKLTRTIIREKRYV